MDAGVFERKFLLFMQLLSLAQIIRWCTGSHTVLDLLSETVICSDSINSHW